MKYFKTIFSIVAEGEETLQTAREVLAADLGECGYEAFEDTEDGIVGYVQQDQYHELAVKDVVEGFFIPDVTVTFQTEEVVDQDWNAAWEEEGFEPITVNNMVTIYDDRHTDDAGVFSTPINIGIHAINAFGTGTHETTRMMVQTLLEQPLERRRVLDCGTGTGILGIVAAKCGATHVVGYDIDEWSVENAQHNAEHNGVGEVMDVYQGDVNVLSHIEGLFDVVVANINRNILLADMQYFKEVMTQDAMLVISGFYEEDVPMLINKAVELGLSGVTRKTDNNWCCIAFK